MTLQRFNPNTTVTIPWDTGDHAVPAMTIEGVSQFVITRYGDRPAGGFVATHIKSGHGVSATFETVDDAVTVARVMDIFDWTTWPPSDELKDRAREALYSYTDRGVGELWPRLAP